MTTSPGDSAPVERDVPDAVWPVPRAVVLITLLLAFLLVGRELVAGVWSSDDEVVHVDLVRAVADQRGFPHIDDRFIEASVWASYNLVGADWSTRVRMLADDAPVWDARPGWSDLGPGGFTGGRNWMTQHPPLYYVLVAAGTELVGVVTPGEDIGSFSQELAVMRVLSMLFMLPLPWLAWATARRLRLGGTVSLVAACLPLAMPRVVTTGAQINNDTLLALGLGVVTYLLARVVTGDRSRRTAVAIAVVGSAVVLTKAFGWFVPLWIPLGYLVAGWFGGRRWREWLTPAALATVPPVLVLGAWVGRNLALFGRVQPRITGISQPAAEGFVPDSLDWVNQAIREFGTTLWAPIRPWWLLGPLAVVAVAALVVGVVGARGRARMGRLTVLIPLAALTAVMLVSSWSAYRYSGRLLGVNARYLLGSVVGVAAVVAAGLGTVVRHQAVRRWMPTVVLAVSLAVQVAGAVTSVGRLYGTPEESFPERLDDLVAWASWPAWVLVIVFVGAAAVAVACFASLAGEARRVDPGRATLGADDPDHPGAVAHATAAEGP